MDKDSKMLMGIFIVFMSLICLSTYVIESVVREETIMVTQVIKFPNRIVIHSYESRIGFARIPMGHSIDKLYIIEVGNIYRIRYTGFKIISIEEVYS